jgi:multidrug efflux pump
VVQSKGEIRVDADIYKMEALGVSFGDISDAIAQENLTISGGNIVGWVNFRRASEDYW